MNIIQTVDLDQLGEMAGESRIFSLTIRDRSRLPRYKDSNETVNKVELIKLLRNLTSAGLKSSKGAIEALLRDEAVEIRAILDWDAEQKLHNYFDQYGITTSSVSPSPSPFDPYGSRVEARTRLLGQIPQLPPSHLSAGEQLDEMIQVAQRLGMYEAADALENLQKLVEKLAIHAVAMG